MTQPFRLGMNNETSTAPVSALLERLVEVFHSAPMRTREGIDTLLKRDRDAFMDAAVPLLARRQNGLGYRYLLARLLDTGLFVELLCKKGKLHLPDAVELLRSATAMDAQFDVKLTRWLLDQRNREWVTHLGGGVEVLLDILSEASPGNRLLPLVVQFLRTSGERVSSKAALLVAQRSQRVELALADEDARVRANAIQALWGVDTTSARRALRNALEDSNNRVVGNSLLGLLRLGDRSVLPHLQALAQHRDPLFRATAAWVMGQTGDHQFLDTLRQLRDSGPENVTSAAERALEQYVARSPELLCRRDLAPRILRISSDRQGVHRVSLLAGLADEMTPPPVVAVRVNGEKVEQIQFRRLAPGSLAVGLLLPAVWPDEIHAALRAVQAARRPVDRLAIARYSPKLTAHGAPPAGTYAPIQGLHLAARQAGSVPRVVYSLEAQAPPRVSREPAGMPSVFDALMAIASAPTALSAPAGAIVFAVSGPVFEAEVPREVVEALLGHVDAHACAIHAIVPADLAPAGVDLLRTLASETGGLLLQADQPGEAARLVELLYRSLTSGLEVSFRAPQPVSRVEIEIECGEAQGVANVELTAEPQTTRHGDKVFYL